MNETLNIEERKPIWIALSDFYLDTELQESDIRHIAFKIIESPYSFEKVKEINKYEIFPVLQPNLMSVAGEWAGFNEEWLINRIQESLSKRNTVKKIGIKGSYLTFKWMFKDYWEKLEKVYTELKSNPESYIVTCKELWKANIEPFEYLENKPELQNSIERIALSHKNQNRLSDFYQYLQEGQYWINLWTAYYLLEDFDLKKSDKLIGLNNEAGIIDFCIETVERNQPYLEKEIAKSNCEKWIKNKKTAYNNGYK
tara:strand:- start:25 stop:789 length:765 start_codon:yes stop_codon:yes gene_type:complete